MRSDLSCYSVSSSESQTGNGFKKRVEWVWKSLTRDIGASFRNSQEQDSRFNDHLRIPRQQVLCNGKSLPWLFRFKPFTPKTGIQTSWWVRVVESLIPLLQFILPLIVFWRIPILLFDVISMSSLELRKKNTNIFRLSTNSTNAHLFDDTKTEAFVISTLVKRSHSRKWEGIDEIPRKGCRMYS